MMCGEVRRLLFWLAVLSPLSAQERWSRVRSGPFEVLSRAGERAAQETLGILDQFRYIFGRELSREDPRTVWPVRVLLVRRGRDAEPAYPPALGRDSFVASLQADVHPTPQWLRVLARILLEANTRPMPRDLEEGLLDFYAQVRIEGNRLRLGMPPPSPTIGWGLVHMLSLHPDYRGKLRPLLYNLQQGLDPEPAWRNATGKRPEQVREEASQWLAQGRLAEETISGRVLDPRTDFRVETADPPAGEIALADLRLAQGRLAEAARLYEAVLARHDGSAEAREGLALTALAAGDAAAARRHSETAIAKGSSNARVWVEAARAETDATKAVAMLRKAAALNPNWAEPLRLLAERLSDPRLRLEALGAAAKLAPRDAGLWRTLAEAQEQAGDYRAAARSWMAAEQASLEEAERARIREIRRTLDARRLEAEAAARRREAEEKERELARLKEEALRRIREAEARANRDAGPPPANVVPWFETERPPGRVQGKLRQVDCLRGVARLLIETADGKQTRLAVRDPSRVVVLGGGKLELTCGPQKAPRTVIIEFHPRQDAALGTAGEVATVEYR
ncbi:MAG: hypothetical protein RMI94_04355 [Bryobacterales bacterium]|nr:hypothetical protein [Bryobacteraceae bacterium]MDW8129756.1 hypothetical protein [Bryobacterales bacterium]